MRLRAFFPSNSLAAAVAVTLSLFTFSFVVRADVATTNKDNLATMLSTTDPTDAHVAEVEGELLQTWHFSQHPFDQEIAGKFLDRYLDTLDYSHLYFLQSDIKEFAPYRTNLQVLTMRDHDVSPCWKIFARFMERAKEHTRFVTNALETEKFTFTGHDRYIVNRHTLPYATNIEGAHQLWHEELRAEYLQHLLSTVDVQFGGPIHLDGSGHMTATISNEDLSTDATSNLITTLPTAFYAKDHREIGTLQIGVTNGLLSLDLPAAEVLKKTTNHFYGTGGEDLGDISFQRIKTTNSHPAGASRPALSPTNFSAVLHLNTKDYAETHKFLTNHYGQLLDNYKDLDRDRVFEIYMNSLARAYDPHSDYMGHMAAENFAIQMKLSLFGIGAILMLKDGFCTISDLKEGPALRSNKINPGDRIVAVAQSNLPPVDVRGMPLDKVVSKIRGPKGTEVTLTIWPAEARDPGTRKEVSLVRDEIRLDDEAAKAMLYETPNPEHGPMRVGVIDLSEFYNHDPSDMPDNSGPATIHSTSTDVATLLKRLKQEHVDGVILDLRKNGGGYLEEAIKLTGLFIPSGPVVQTKDPNGDIVTDRCLNRTVLYDGPLIVLTSRPYTASASEIFAGAIQDYNRGLIVGDHSTFGKGTVQTMQHLQPFLEQQHLSFDYDPGDLKVTIKKFYRAGGLSTQLKGVLSDVELPSLWDYATEDVGESSLPNALPCDEVPSASPENLNRVTPYLAELQRRSRERVAHNKDFDYVREDIAQYLKEQADKSISLNRADRLAEQKADTDRIETRRVERLSRKKPDEKIYEITLKNVFSPTLEPPPAKTNAVAAVQEPEADDDSDAAAAAEQPSTIDPQLDEARRIMEDYVSLRKGEAPLTKAP